MQLCRRVPRRCVQERVLWSIEFVGSARRRLSAFGSELVVLAAGLHLSVRINNLRKA